VLDPQALSARQICELYRRRWRIEDAFAWTKRLLDLAYVWTGSTNAVQLQIYATLMCYAVLVTICRQVAQALGEPMPLSSPLKPRSCGIEHRRGFWASRRCSRHLTETGFGALYRQ
jgi:IS4 transposase